MALNGRWIMIEIRHGDCIEVMRAMDDACVDMICCDLPYGTTRCKWDTVIPFAPLWEQYKRVLKKDGIVVLTAAQPFTSALVMSNLPWFRYDLTWDKVGTTGFLNANKMPLRRHEDICVFYQGQPTYNPRMVQRGAPRTKGGKRNCKGVYGAVNDAATVNNLYHPTSIIEVSGAAKAGKVHPTQKPVGLIEYLIRTYTNEGETVLDNCMGSGTAGVACINTGRRFIGIEKDAGYFNIAAERIATAREGLGLFAVAAE
jgi:site-specific DNA-methyltransferase (adenine-specific)